MDLKIKSIHILAIFFILTILMSSVSALEFVEDYDLTPKSFNGDESWRSIGFMVDVPSESNFTLMKEYSGPVKNSDGKGNLSVFVNYGEFSTEVPMMVFIESDDADGSLGTEFVHDLMKNYREIDSDESMLVLELDNSSEIYYDSEDNGTDLSSSSDDSVDTSSDLSSSSDDFVDDSSDSNSTDNLNQMSYAEPEYQASHYAIACTSEDGDKAFVLFGNELDLMKDMCEQFYFESYG